MVIKGFAHGRILRSRGFSVGLAALRLQNQRQHQKPERAIRGMAGRGGWSGHAVNPSMGARWRHPWRQRSCPPTPPHLRQLADSCWWVPTVGRHICRIPNELVHAWRGSTGNCGCW
ncbi:Hypothetical protein EPM1_4335 [Stenotrophomonas maltophilia EPM1]|nr:Hypothetical protein EPM1_4335 [Stenotrophomonas maltophilia EPM1]